MAVEIWSGQRGDSPKPADVLASQVRELIRQLPLSDFPVTMSRITNYAQLPDFESGCPRVILQCQLHIQAD